jgi:3-oxoacyl-(acyl-carrier-protein) synthase
MGMVTPLGDGVDTNWRRLMAGDSGIRSIQAFDTSDLATKIGGEVPQGDKANGHFNADLYMLPKDQRRSTSSSCSAWRPPSRRSKIPAGSLSTMRVSIAQAS